MDWRSWSKVMHLSSGGLKRHLILMLFLPLLGRSTLEMTSCFLSLQVCDYVTVLHECFCHVQIRRAWNVFMTFVSEAEHVSHLIPTTKRHRRFDLLFMMGNLKFIVPVNCGDGIELRPLRFNCSGSLKAEWEKHCIIAFSRKKKLIGGATRRVLLEKAKLWPYAKQMCWYRCVSASTWRQIKVDITPFLNLTNYVNLGSTCSFKSFVGSFERWRHSSSNYNPHQEWMRNYVEISVHNLWSKNKVLLVPILNVSDDYHANDHNYKPKIA